MGFTIFESSGTFNPASYGLKAGDLLQIVCVGGGGQALQNERDGASGVGTTGGTSSFGSYVTALGGSGSGFSSTGTQGGGKGAPRSGLYQGGGGGGGYGGGGGGGCSSQYNRATYGANGGEIKMAAINLTSTSSIAVTVGAGGGTAGSAGSGASDCVAIYW